MCHMKNTRCNVCEEESTSFIIETTAYVEIHAHNEDEAVDKFLKGDYDYLNVSLDERNFKSPYREDYEFPKDVS